MSIITKIAELSSTVNASDIRNYFFDITIPPDGIHFAHEKNIAFISFNCFDDVWDALDVVASSKLLNGEKVNLSVSDENEMNSYFDSSDTELLPLSQKSTLGETISSQLNNKKAESCVAVSGLPLKFNTKMAINFVQTMDGYVPESYFIECDTIGNCLGRAFFRFTDHLKAASAIQSQIFFPFDAQCITNNEMRRFIENHRFKMKNLKTLREEMFIEVLKNSTQLSSNDSMFYSHTYTTENDWNCENHDVKKHASNQNNHTNIRSVTESVAGELFGETDIDDRSRTAQLMMNEYSEHEQRYQHTNGITFAPCKMIRSNNNDKYQILQHITDCRKRLQERNDNCHFKRSRNE